MLYSSVEGEGRPVILLHGLFGMGDNLALVDKALRDDFQVHRLDLRNHGRSPHQHSMSLGEMAADIAAYMDQQEIQLASILGHSLGGKVAMQLALDYPQRVLRLVVADIAPVAYRGSHEPVFAGIKAVELAKIKTRSDANKILKGFIEEDGVRLFILKSLYRNDRGVFDWRMNVAALEENYHKLCQANVAVIPFDGRVLFIKGENSAYIQPKHRGAITTLFPHAEFKIIENTGHWLHAEKPVAFNNVSRRFLLADD